MIAPIVIRPGGTSCRVPLGEALRLKTDAMPAICTAREIDENEEAAIVAEYLVCRNLRKVGRAHHIAWRRAVEITDRAGIVRSNNLIADTPPDIAAAIIADRQVGTHITAIADRHRVSETRVRFVLRSAGLGGRFSKMRYHEPEIRRRLAAGESCREISRDVGICRSSVERIWREARDEGRL